MRENNLGGGEVYNRAARRRIAKITNPTSVGKGDAEEKSLILNQFLFFFYNLEIYF